MTSRSSRTNPRPAGTCRLRSWIASLPPPRRADGTEFDKARIAPYAYRHTYAQRHADAGVPVDVLAALMDHRSLNTTRGYYNSRELQQPGEKPQVSRSRQGRDSVPCLRTAAV